VVASLALGYAAYTRRVSPANRRIAGADRAVVPPAVRDEGVASAAGARAIQRVGLVRFNPYHDTGGEYSFTVALLDANGTGLLLTGLYHREQSRVYAKEVSGWTSQQELMDEEREAIERARGASDL
jgi:uncharacterized protein DUF4446